jgi:hypothetical protein
MDLPEHASYLPGTASYCDDHLLLLLQKPISYSDLSTELLTSVRVP